MKVTGSTNVIKKKKRGVQGKIARKRLKDNTLANTLKVHAKNIVESTEGAKSTSDGISVKQSPDKPIFAGLNINVSELNKTLSTQCVPVTKNSIPKHFPKKEKRKLRHEAFLKKIESVPEVRQKERKKRRRLKKTGDVVMESEVPTAVPDTLQPIESKQPEKKQKKELKNVSKKPIPKTKTRLEQDARDIELFKRIMSNPEYQSDPGAAITNYVLHNVRESIQSE